MNGPDPDKKWLLVTYHPLTYKGLPTEEEISNLIEALTGYLNSHQIIFTMPNSDNSNSLVREKIFEFSELNEQVFTYENLGTPKYLSVMSYSDAVIGNSSSGLYEAPLLNVPTVDLGLRQRGRERGQSVITSRSECKDIILAIGK